jgi:D-alanyl-lipoteichoic acid acyltransferase DltB (MBOAT superfamily)
MSFDSLPFLGFLAFVLAGYWLLPQRFRWVLLLLVSYVFCASWAPRFVIPLALSTLSAYLAARLMGKTSDPKRRRFQLALGGLISVGLLHTFKYLGFAAETLRTIVGFVGLADWVTVPNLLLPVGISFYSLQAIGYLIDVYRGKVEPEKHLGLFALYMAFFARLISGPIERAEHLIPQFRQTPTLDAPRLFSGLRLLLWGMFKKVVVADRLAIYVNEVYGQPGDHAGWTVVIAMFFSAAHIFADFSGYSDMAVGVARLFDVDVIQNFQQPYLAASVSDFWRRWHISLSSWLRDYIYIPLGGNRVPPWRRSLNVLITFLVSGLWHGAAWTFVFWGLLHGVYIVLESWGKGAADWVFKTLRLERTGVRRATGTLVTLLLVSFAWILFYSRSVPDAALLIRNMARLGSGTDVYAPWASLSTSPGVEMALAWGLIGLLALVHVGRERGLPRTSFVVRYPGVRWAAYLVVALATLNLGVANQLPFLYAGF